MKSNGRFVLKKYLGNIQMLTTGMEVVACMERVDRQVPPHPPGSSPQRQVKTRHSHLDALVDEWLQTALERIFHVHLTQKQEVNP